MNTFIKLLVILLSCTSTALIFENFMSFNFQKKMKGNYFLYFGSCVIINSIVNLVGNTYLNYLWSLIYIIFISFFLYKSDDRNTFLPIFILLILIVVEETLVCYFLEYFFNFLSIPFDNFYYIAVFGSNIVLILLYKPIKSLLSSKAINRRSNHNIFEFILLVFSFISIISLSLFMKINLPSYLLVILIMICIMISCFDIYLVFVLDRIDVNNKLKEEIKIMALHNKLNENYYKSKLDQYNQQSKLFHDMKHHLSVIDALYNNDEKEKAKKYTNELIQKMNYNSISISNKVLRILLNDFIDQCKANDVEFKFQIDSRIGYENIKDIDVVAIYSNILSNAFEASLKCDSPFIELKMNIYNDMVITILSNNYSGTINEEANKIISSKKNHIGYGLENATEAIKNYNGIFDINYENNVFTIEIILPFGG